MCGGEGRGDSVSVCVEGRGGGIVLVCVWRGGGIVLVCVRGDGGVCMYVCVCLRVCLEGSILLFYFYVAYITVSPCRRPVITLLLQQLNIILH